MDITLTADKMGRPVAVIPDEAALLLREASHEGWSDVADFNTGSSRLFGKGHPAWELADDFLNSLPDRAPRGPIFIVGASGWDPDARWWSARFPEFNVPTIVRTHQHRSIYFTG